MKNFKEFCFKASRLLAITIIGFFILLALNKILYPFERNPDDIKDKIEVSMRNVEETFFVVDFKLYIRELEKDYFKYYKDEVLREYIKKKLHIVNYKHNCDFYGNNLDISNILLAIEDLEDLEYEYKEKLLDSGEAIKIFKYEFKYKLRERKKNLE